MDHLWWYRAGCREISKGWHSTPGCCPCPYACRKGEELGAPPDRRWGLWLRHLLENKLFDFTFILLILVTPVVPGQLEARVPGAVNTGETSQLSRAQSRVGKGGSEGPVWDTQHLMEVSRDSLYLNPMDGLLSRGSQNSMLGKQQAVQCSTGVSWGLGLIAWHWYHILSETHQNLALKFCVSLAFVSAHKV